MRPPWKMQLASDVIRDGLGLELVDDTDRIVAEVFRCDADHSVRVSVFDASVSSDVLDEFVEHARSRLGTFDDGTPLPGHFNVEHAV